jgi:hypothetical protein
MANQTAEMATRIMQCKASDNPFGKLGLNIQSDTITKATIVHAFREMSRYLHPDRTNGNAAADQAFREMLAVKEDLIQRSDDEIGDLVAKEKAKHCTGAATGMSIQDMSQFNYWLSARKFRTPTAAAKHDSSSPLCGFMGRGPEYVAARPTQIVTASFIPRTPDTAPLTAPALATSDYLRKIFTGCPQPVHRMPLPVQITRPTCKRPRVARSAAPPIPKTTTRPMCVATWV